MKRTVRTRGARSSYGGQPSTSYISLPHPDGNISLHQLENILSQNMGSYDPDHLQGLFTKIDGADEQNCSTPPPTEEEIALHVAKVDELNLQRLFALYPFIGLDKLSQMYELCEKNIIRTMDNINFYSHMNKALQNAFKNIRSCAFKSGKWKPPTLKNFEDFANAFVKGCENEAENVSTSEGVDHAVAGSSHFDY